MSVVISERAVTKLVEAAIRCVPGTVSVATGMGKLTGRSYPLCDVSLDDDGDTATVEAFIAVTWPSPLLSVAETVRSTIIDHVRTLAGIEVLACNVMIGQVLASSERVTENDLDLPALEPTPITIGARR